ncbi:SPOR domain-containing protein [Lysobacter enzymogenes]|uniref:Sporulation domain-containing protein n=1 Tax=Lysobacter enzymogenes TaxID=69 RepID=A0AAU9APS0_LYSEN|nr:SPOR domain-containing protein [Lysobacter enzymogenes]BAV96371.1 sporulation domain-containing protein [Lysobacter enzymogenes]
MLVRALIVLLTALNLGVAAWWIARPAPPPPAEEKLPLGVARLQLLDEGKRTTTAASSLAAGKPAQTPSGEASPSETKPGEALKLAEAKPADAKPADATSTSAAPAETKPAAAKPEAIAAATPPPVPATPPQCFSVGPFADAAAADAARAKLLPLAQKVSSRSLSGGSNARGWRVYLPTANADAAQAMAQRIRTAGFSDLFVMSGADANAIALGRFRSEESARRRGNELAAAGFAVKVEALGESSGQVWLDAATATAKGEALRVAAGAQRWRGISCDKVR